MITAKKFLKFANFNLPILLNVQRIYEHIFSDYENNNAVLAACRLNLVW